MKKKCLQMGAALLIVMALLQVTPVWAKPPVITITIEFGNPDNKCDGWGLCRITIDVNLKTAGRPGPKEVTASALVEGDHMMVTFQGPVPARGKETMLPVVRDMALSPEISKGLGFKSVVILKGHYSINEKAGKFGGVTLNVKTEKEAAGTTR
ncbi:MAG: hypothetical protein PHX83_03775 [Acidobacteriia bacterium]|nr:hypothetical protein [Terriglobia bacterium]